MSIAERPTAFGRTEDLLPAVSGGPSVRNGTALGIDIVGPTGDQRIDGLLTSVAWDGERLNYSAPDHRSDYGTPYHEPLDTLTPLSAGQLLALHFALNTTTYNPGGVQSGTFSVEAFADVGITYTAGGSGGAVMRYANSKAPTTAYAFYPDEDDPRAGDAFFGGAGRQPVQGNYDYLTILHEAGHTLGLKHAHDGATYGAVPGAWDSMEHTVMSYRAWAGGPLSYGNETFGFAQTWMMLDIAALQQMYGANFGINAGNTVYSWGEGDGSTYVNGLLSLDPGANRIFMTIWDGGGTDTYDLTNYATHLEIDLTPGGHSRFSDAQTAYLGEGRSAQGNVYNALQYRGDPRSLIENAYGGAGDDAILGNVAHNGLEGGAGDDEIYGAFGNDIIGGGSGNDLLDGGTGIDDLGGGAGNDQLDGGGGDDVMMGGIGNDTYEVDSLSDFVAEFANEGTDTILSTVVHTLGDNFENLTLVGAFATGGTGNGLANRLTGSTFGNTLVGLGGADVLLGDGGADFLRGGDGGDRLTGGLGADVLMGGRGADVFDFDLASHSSPGLRDLLRAADGAVAFEGAGAAAGDRIDVSGVDANQVAAGNQAFSFGGAGIACLSLVAAGASTLVRCNTDRDAAFELELLIEDAATLASAYRAGDFVL